MDLGTNTCLRCHSLVRGTDYFCFNCGQNLHPVPLSLTPVSLLSVGLGTLLLPPLGIVWGIRYLKQQSNQAKIFGMLCIVVTIVELVLVTYFSIQMLAEVQKQVDEQLQTIQGF